VKEVVFGEIILCFWKMTAKWRQT